MSRAAHPAGPRYADVLQSSGVGGPPADLNALDPKIWPITASRDEESGQLTLGGLGVRVLAERQGTPAYVLDEADWRRRAQTWLAAFGDFDRETPPVHYAGKSFLSKAIARWAAEEGLGLDVSSGGELAVALAAGFPAFRITMHGNNKSVAELERAVDAGVGRIVLDSFDEIDRLAAVARERGIFVEVMVRVTVGVEAHTHEFIATAHEDQKFGFALAGGVAADAVRQVLKYGSAEGGPEGGLELVGLAGVVHRRALRVEVAEGGQPAPGPAAPVGLVDQVGRGAVGLGQFGHGQPAEGQLARGGALGGQRPDLRVQDVQVAGGCGHSPAGHHVGVPGTGGVGCAAHGYIRSGALTPSRARPLATTVCAASASHSLALVSSGSTGNFSLGRIRHSS